MAAKFLCCLPLRLGVLVISFLQLLLSGGIAGILWWALWYANENSNDFATITQSMKKTVIIVASIYTAAALVSLLGLLGALFKKNGFVKTFYILLCATLSLQIGGGIWYLVTFYRTRGQTLEDCLNGTTDSNRIAYCGTLEAYKRVPQGTLIASVIVPIILQAYACYIVYQYSKRLEFQKIENLRSSRAFVPPTGPVYQAVKPTDETYPLAQPHYPASHYPYADSPNSFGHMHYKSLEASNKV
jgi:hypothetical protein